MESLDWTVVGIAVFALVGIMLAVKRLNRSVADFVAANRCAGRYLICVAEGAAALGIMSFLGQFEQYYDGGFVPAFWWLLVTPVYLIIAMSGWIIYRFRCTRAFTYAQFYEMRYSRNFRIFAGIGGFIALLALYGLAPAIAARFLMSFAGLPECWSLLGIQVPMFQTLMVAVILLPLFITMTGGQITVMVTDFLQGQIVQITLLAVSVFLLFYVDWSQVVEIATQGTDAGSLVNPFDSPATKTFNAPFFFMWIAIAFYSFGVSPASQGYQASAINPHESQMARVWSILRNMVTITLPFFIPVVAYTILHHPDFSDIAATMRSTIASVPDEGLQSQVTTPVVLTFILPAGLRGLFLICTMATAITTDSTLMQSLGTLFAQDIVIPLRGKPLKPKMHMLVLRGSMLCVGILAFIFSLVFPQNEFLMMYMLATLGIYLAGAGIVTIGGLYWRKGSTLGAWGAMASGMALNIGFITLRAIDPDFPINGMEGTCIASLLATIVYVTLSLMKPANHDLDKLLNRSPEDLQKERQPAMQKLRTGIRAFFKLPPTFTRFDDKLAGYAVKALIVGMLLVFIGTTIYNLLFDVSDSWWMGFWRNYLGFVMISAFVIAVSLLIGGIYDFKKMVKLLGSAERDAADDGFVDKAG